MKSSNVFVTPVKNSCEFVTDVTNTCKSFISVKDSHEFFKSVIRTHYMCDKFIKNSICNAFILTAAYLPKHNTVLWKEKCWGDIRLFLRRLGIGRTRRWNFTKSEPGTKRPYLSTDRFFFFFFVLALLGIEANTIGKFHSNPSSSFWRDAITRKLKDGRRRPCLSTDRNSVSYFTTRHWVKHSDQVSKTSDQWSWRRCDNKKCLQTDSWTDRRTPESSQIVRRRANNIKNGLQKGPQIKIVVIHPCLNTQVA